MNNKRTVIQSDLNKPKLPCKPLRRNITILIFDEIVYPFEGIRGMKIIVFDEIYPFVVRRFKRKFNLTAN